MALYKERERDNFFALLNGKSIKSVFLDTGTYHTPICNNLHKCKRHREK